MTKGNWVAYTIFIVGSILLLKQAIAQENDVILFVAPAMVPADVRAVQSYIKDYSKGRGAMSSFVDTGAVIFVPAEHTKNLQMDLEYEFGYFTQACSDAQIDGYSDEMAAGFVKYNQSPKQNCSPVQLTNRSEIASVNIGSKIDTIVLSGLPYVRSTSVGFESPTKVDSLPYSEQVKWFVMHCDDEDGREKACGPIRPSDPNPEPRNPEPQPDFPILPSSAVYPLSKCCDPGALSIVERQACGFTLQLVPTVCE